MDATRQPHQNATLDVVRHALPEAHWPTAEEAASSRLFSSVRLGPIEARTRTWVPAMVPWRATEDGEVTRDVIDWYARFALGKPGVLVVEATGVDAVGPNKPSHRVIADHLRATSFLSYELNLDLRRLGIPRDAFGSVMITNIGSIGLQEAYVPLIAYSRVPMILALGNVEDVPVVDDGELVAGKTMKVCATFDHRLLDGSHAVVIARTLREWFAHPFDHFDPVPRP